MITSIEDPRLAPYRDLRNRDPTCHGSVFIAEGRLNVHRLLASDYQTVSVVVQANRENMLPAEIPAHVEVLRLPREAIEQLLGFDFHRGVIACARRRPMQTITEYVDAREKQLSQSSLFVMLCGVNDLENVGSIIRSSAGFGAEGVIIGPGTADPLSRRVLRVSMATALNVPLLLSSDPAADLRHLAREHGIRSIAATLADDAIPLSELDARKSTVLVLGNEYAGVPDDIQEACTSRVTLPMQRNTDSLNVAVAAGIFLYQLSQLR